MKNAVNSMTMFRSSFWNKDEAVSKKVVITTAARQNDTANGEQKNEFEEKKPFIKTKWFNLKAMVGTKTVSTYPSHQKTNPQTCLLTVTEASSIPIPGLMRHNLSTPPLLRP